MGKGWGKMPSKTEFQEKLDSSWEEVRPFIKTINIDFSYLCLTIGFGGFSSQQLILTVGYFVESMILKISI